MAGWFLTKFNKPRSQQMLVGRLETVCTTDTSVSFDTFFGREKLSESRKVCLNFDKVDGQQNKNLFVPVKSLTCSDFYKVQLFFLECGLEIKELCF